MQITGTVRRHIVHDGDEYLVDIMSNDGWTVIAQDISTGKFGKGHHETSEGRAIAKAIENTK